MTYLFKLWASLSNVGVQSRMPFYIKRRVNITNSFSWIMMIFCLSLITIFFNDPHFKKNSLIALFALGCFILTSNYLKFTGLSRFLLSVCPAILLLISSVVVKLQDTQNIGLEHYLSIQYVIGATIVLPFTLFHWKEKVAMLGSVFLVLILAIFFNKIHTWFDVSSQDLNVKIVSQAIINTNLYITFALLFLSLLFLLSMNNRYSRNSDKLLQEVKNKNKLAQKRELDLQNTLAALKESKQQEKEQSWITQGLADFAQYFRKQSDLNTLSKQIISSLVKHIEAVQGAIYIVKESEKTPIELVASYAFDKFYYEKKKYMAYESLVGQVYAKRKKIYLDNLPDDYLAISSGLGKTSPKYLLIVPVFNEESVEGIIEIASLEPILPYKVEFIERLSESLASAMLSIKVNSLSLELLRESQKQTEILKQQEDELKDSLKQLAYAENETSKAQKELQYTFQALEKSMMVAEFDKFGKFIHFNTNFEKLLGYQLIDLKNKELKEIISSEDFEEEEYLALWKKLNDKKSDVGEYKFLAKLGYYLWFRGTYSPIINNEGEIVKVMLLAYNITVEKEQEITLQEQNKIIQNNERLMLERIKSVQDKAYQRIKKMKKEYEERLEDKEKELAQLYFQLKEQEDLNMD